MKKLIKSQKNLDIFFSFLNNKIYYKQTPIFFSTSVITRTALMYINLNKTLNITLQIWEKNRNLYFFKSLFNLFISIQQTISKLHINDGFFIRLNLIGLGFRIQKISEKIFHFSLGWANGIYFLVPKELRVFILSKKRQLIVFGFNINKVYNIISMLILLRKSRPYRITGFVNPIFIHRLRSGKQR